MGNKKAITCACLLMLVANQGVAKDKRPGPTIQSSPTLAPINVDGERDEHWAQAKAISIELNELPYEPNNGYDGIKKTDVEIRTLYDDEHIYFLFSWYDPSKDLARFTWEKGKGGEWKQLSNKDSTLHENTYYEDKFAIYWNVNEKGFIKKGCDKSCHMVEDGAIEGVLDDSAGRHFTLHDDEYLDEWHWKAARTNPIGMMDDGFVDNERQTAKKWGRKMDSPTAGGYYNNTNDSPFPAWMNKLGISEAPYWVYDDNKVAFIDTHKPGDRVGGIVISKFEKSRGDVTAKGLWKDNYWTLEIKRKRKTDHENSKTQDIQFEDLNKAYHFGVTAFDNSQINHIYHKKSIKLTFEK